MATADAIAEEVDETRGRATVVKRWAGVADGLTTLPDKNGKSQRLFADDVNSNVLSALLPAERERIELVVRRTSPSVDVLDVSQNLDKRARLMLSGQPTFHTVIACSGHLVRLDTMRADKRNTTFVTAHDVRSMSGFPITHEQVTAAGSPCMFSSTCEQPLAERSAQSMKKQVGNAMHFTNVGAVFLCALATLRALGSESSPTGSCTIPQSIGTRKRSPSPTPAASSAPSSSLAMIRNPSPAPAASSAASSSSLAPSEFLRAVRALRGAHSS